MNEQQIQELKNLVDKLQAEGLPQDQIQAQVDAKKQEFQQIEKPYNEGILPDFQTPTTPGAVVEETAAPDTESKSEDGLSELASARLPGSVIPFRKQVGFAASLADFGTKALEYIKGVTETATKYRSTQLVEQGKITQEQQDLLLNNIEEDFTDLLEPLRSGVKELQDVSTEMKQAVYEEADRSVYDEFFSEEGNVVDGLDKITDNVIEALPSVMSVFAGPAGMATLFASASGSAYKEKTDADPNAVGDLSTLAISTGQGGIELVSELVTRGILKGFGNTVFSKITPSAAKNLYKNATKTLTGKVITGGTLEGVSENLAQETNRYIDFLWGDDRNVAMYKNELGGYDIGDIVDRTFETFITGFIIGAPLASMNNNPVMQAYTLEKLSPTAAKKQTLESAKKIKELENLYAKAPNEAILDEILELQKSVVDNKILNKRVLESFDDAELSEYVENKFKISELKRQKKLAKEVEVKDQLDKIITKQEQKVDAQYNDKLSRLIKILEKPIKPEGALLSDFGILSAADKIREVALDKAKQTKISNDVQKIYEEKGVEGAFEIIEKFKPITNKLVRKRREAPNYDEQLLRDEIETGERGILDLIREYKADSGVPLSGYINKFLPARAIEASKRVLGEQFTQDVTEIRESKIDLDDTTQETIDFVRTEPKAKEQLRDIAGITKESVQKDATEILKGKLPGIVEKSGRDQNEILTAINNASKLKISDSVLEEMGGNFKNTEEQNSRFATFLDTNYDAIIKSIPDAVKNKLPVFQKIDTGKREQTKEGKKIFEYKIPTKEQMLSFYTEGGFTTLRARKLKLADILAQEIGKDAIAEVLADPNVQKEFLERQELLGKEIPQDAIPRLLQRIDRTIEKIQKEGDKFKGITAIGVSPKLITDSLVGGLKIIKKGLEAGLSFQKALSKGIDYIKRKLKSEAAGDVIGAEIQTIEDLKKLTNEQFLTYYRENVQEAIDTEVELGKQNKAYFKDLKSLNIKEALDLSRLKFNINESKLDKIKSNRLIKATPKEKQDFINKGKEVVSAMPKQGKELFIDGKNTTLLQGLLGFHYRYVGSGQAPILYDNISTKQPAWISDKTKELFKNLPKKIVTANDLKSVQIAINEAKTKEEKIQVAKNNLNKIKKHQKDVDAVFYAHQSLLSDYVYSAKNEQDLINKIDYVTKIKSTNSNNVNGDRALVKVNGFYIGPLGKKVKLEHVKTSAEQSIQGLQQILSGNIDTNITADFEGVYGFEFDSKGKSTFGFSKIDKSGKTNVSQYYRFKDPKDAANYILAEYNFEGSIANKNVLKIFNQIKKDKARNENVKEIYNKKDLNKEFNKFLEKSTGIGAEKVFSRAKAEARAKTVRKGFGDYFVPPGAEDFAGLMHKTLAKGKEGEKQLKFYQDNLYTPYNVANENITRERAAMFEDFRALKKKLSNVPKKLKQFTKGGDFTNDQAVRAFIWARQGNKVPGLSKTDARELINEVKNDKELLQFAEELLNITKGDGYAKPENNWIGGNIATDLMSLMNSTKRSKHLEVWQNNVDQIFSEQNLNKLEAAYGKEWVTNLKKTLERMKIGSNRKWGGDKVLQSYLDWVNGSVGAIMFLNTRSAVLQTISNINYLNFSDNNPLQAAKAFANQKQYWSDFKTIFNSDYLQERRGGNKINVNESELALAAEKGGIQGTISLLLNKGFIFTKIADSFAIASGGASMYRNRINKYIKEGLSEKEATEKAFVDFKAITEETQQSSRPDRISEQQASNAGRLFLAFANTPMQYNRIIKKNAQDLVAGRGNKMEKVSKIIYYSTIQNLIFNAMQKALFALAFAEDDEDEKEIEKYSQIANGMADSLLRGMGMTGNAAVAVKNIATDIANRMDRPRPNFQDAAWKALTISPPIYSKVSKLRGAGYSLGYTTPENIFEPKLDNPALSAGANIISATTNIPLDRALRKAQNIEAAMSDEAEWWQSTALLMGWGSWELGMENQKDKKEKQIKRKPINRQTIERKSITRK